FQAAGRLGCPHDYEAFGTALAGLLERIHRADRHGGKVPRRHPGGDAELRRQLRRAVREERFEDAARLRDLIRRRQAPDEPERHAPEPG
ncbi:MAG TPA: UvrB/UvrC motif-containing protein, partial [Gemmataceae bacterium]